MKTTQIYKHHKKYRKLCQKKRVKLKITISCWYQKKNKENQIKRYDFLKLAAVCEDDDDDAEDEVEEGFYRNCAVNKIS